MNPKGSKKKGGNKKADATPQTKNLIKYFKLFN